MCGCEKRRKLAASDFIMRQITPLLLVLSATAGRLCAQEVKVEIIAGRAAENVIVYIPLNKPLAPSATAYELIDRKKGIKHPAQLADSMTLVCILRGELNKGTHSYAVRPAAYKPKPGIRIEKQPAGLLVSQQGKPIFFYHTAVASPPAGSPDHYKRSGFIHPLYSPDGSILTDDFPAGHMHQHGIFLTWVNTTFRGMPLDFWNQHHNTGTVEHVEVISIDEGPIFSRIKTKLRHVSLAHGPVLEEIWTLTIYDVYDGHYVFDLGSEQVNITTDTLYVNKYHYGGLAFRGSREWNRHDSVHFRNHWQILTSEGKDASNANHTRARWVNASGKINGKMNGVTVFNDPANFRYPQAIRVHPDMPYWCYSPMVDGPFALGPGVPYKSRFRFMVHAGAPDVQVIRNEEMNWADPVKVVVK